MANVCEVTGKGPMAGNNVSHSLRRTKRRFHPNLHKRRFWLPSEQRYITLKVSNHGLRIIDKRGIEVVWKEIKKRKKKDN